MIPRSEKWSSVFPAFMDGWYNHRNEVHKENQKSLGFLLILRIKPHVPAGEYYCIKNKTIILVTLKKGTEL